MTRLPAIPVVDVHDAGMTRVLEAAAAACGAGQPVTLAVVLETEGSTYARAGSMVLFGEHTQVGWLSGGCLEPEIERVARDCADAGRSGWMEIDTRDDSALFSGNAVGCRGCQRLLLLPLSALAGCAEVLQAWLRGHGPLQLDVDVGGGVHMACAGQVVDQLLPSDPCAFGATQGLWSLRWMPPPRVLLLGAGPEVTALWPMLRGLGWQVRGVDPRAAWRERSHVEVEALAAPAALADASVVPDVVLVMHHNFELDLQALEALAPCPVPFIGLLGPTRRRDDLFSLLPVTARLALQPRLHSPVGLDLGGRGPDAIALSIAAQLQSWRHGVMASA
ncbi:xanthine dehydrogenase accessory factor [Stenotrophomonas maltophilia]|uniref:XdhC family protein n=1 Tax=Stenotrophomonas chelatiphaga TaxID=517011 RepID=UPI000FA6B573|nr:XdhC/CoxI family protein [Stenotrophomonas chelatiphaga]MCS4229477.1 xanthine dehydrogenase accessory factor [Stenotrophomonas chelatiphaga]ROQ46074.1 xanthine dehydrogenase accessory factor [Stenotrophomonas maltophilia]